MMSSAFKTILTIDFAESQKNMIPIIGPKYEEFLELIKVIHPPYEDIKASTYESLLSWGHYFDIKLVFLATDKFLALHDKVPLIKKLVVIDKYDEKLPETKRLVLDEFNKNSVVRELIRKPEFATLTDGMKARLLLSLISLYHTKMSKVLDIMWSKCMFMGDIMEHQKSDIQLIGTPKIDLKYEEFLELMQMIHPPGGDIEGERLLENIYEILEANYDYLLSLAHIYDIDFLFRLVDKRLRNVPLVKKLLAIDKYDEKLPLTKSFVFEEFKKVSTARELMKKPEFKTLHDGMKRN